MIIDKSIIPKNRDFEAMRENRDFEAMRDEKQAIYNYSSNIDLGNSLRDLNINPFSDNKFFNFFILYNKCLYIKFII